MAFSYRFRSGEQHLRDAPAAVRQPLTMHDHIDKLRQQQMDVGVGQVLPSVVLLDHEPERVERAVGTTYMTNQHAPGGWECGAAVQIATRVETAEAPSTRSTAVVYETTSPSAAPCQNSAAFPAGLATDSVLRSITKNGP